MSDTPKYNFPNAQKVQIFEHVDTYIENNHTLSTADQTAIAELKQIIQDLQTRYPTTEPTQQTAIIEAEFEEIKQKQPWKWKNLLNAGRLLNGGKAALTKAGEHLFEENIWGKAAIGFLEGVTENIESIRRETLKSISVLALVRLSKTYQIFDSTNCHQNPIVPTLPDCCNFSKACFL